MRINELWLVYVWFLCKMASMAIMELVEETFCGYFSERHALSPNTSPLLKKCLFILSSFLLPCLSMCGLYIVQSFVAAIKLSCLEIC